MPTYDYECGHCQHKFEQYQSITAAPIRKCPECGKNKVKRLIGTGAGIIFKGSGFYITDYRSDSYKAAAKADSGEKSSTNGESKSKDSATSTAPAASKPASEVKPAKSGSKDSKTATPS